MITRLTHLYYTSNKIKSRPKIRPEVRLLYRIRTELSRVQVFNHINILIASKIVAFNMLHLMFNSQLLLIGRH